MCGELAGYAVVEALSVGREHREDPHPYRSAFERDRDRIIHCSAFRRLEGKTQVFTPGLDDYYRTRLTHSIEVAQIGRTIARALRLNESLAEAICLAHDLGHPPFGHAGEAVLDELMAGHGGFEHNQQSLRIVELLEHPYPGFMGLNLMYETRLGLAKHKSRYDRPQDQRFDQANCSLEGQVADIADRIAYNCHDLEDGMRAGLIETEQALEVPIVRRAFERVGAGEIRDRTMQRTRTAKAIIDRLAGDCIETTTGAVAALRISTLEDVYQRQENVVVLRGRTESELAELEDFLLSRFYQHESLMQIAEKVRRWLGALFRALYEEPERMPLYFQRFVGEQGLHRVVCDYIAGMTDRFCLKTLDSLDAS